MDKKIVQTQIAYWEAQLKEGERVVKVQQDQNATIKATIKNLKAMLPKEKADEAPEVSPMPDEYSPS